MHRDGYCIFGHIHNHKDEAAWPFIRDNPFLLNAGVDVNWFSPVLFPELQENNRKRADPKASPDLSSWRRESLSSIHLGECQCRRVLDAWSVCIDLDFIRFLSSGEVEYICHT